MRIAAIALTFLATPLPAQDLIVQFADGAPKDSISFQTAGCDITNAMVMIDLAGSKGGLIFDVDPSGSEAEVYQPVEITHGYGALSPVRDGDKRLQVLVHSLIAGDTLDLTADLDDTLDGAIDVTVNGSEMAGASVRLALSDRVLSGIFDNTGVAKIALPKDDSVCLAAAN